ncbi:BPSS1780 family membrane protein [Methylotetracoccus oryzae]|uniref:BPSS1780 family membrane protein n=1 Tax=Methylotetracoccus oryzae TaxID=1919059 RepID=UPI00111AC8BB|nr:BPSS1780 family membrane protein [Methylotetracoccus oryzae]
MPIARVEAGRGWSWVIEGFALFRRDPAIWIGCLLVYLLAALTVSAVPAVGPLASTALQTVLLAGLLIGCREVEGGGRLTFSHLLSGWRAQGKALVVLGIIVATGWFAVLLVMYAPFAAMMGMGYFGSALTETPEWPESLPVDLDPSMIWASLAVLAVALLLAVPVAMATWFAPAVMVLRNIGVADALRASFLGCWRNIWPLSVYTLLLVLAGVIALIPFGLGFLVLGPVWVTSFYASYRDIFGAPDRR